MKVFCKRLCFVLAIIIVLAIPVSASEEVAQWASYYFRSSSTYLWKVNSTTFEVWYDITAVEGMDELGVSEIKVQRSTNGTNWTTMYTYTKELYPQFIVEDTAFHSGYVTYTGSPGYYYRAYVTYYAKKGTGSAEAYRYTDSMLLQ